MALGSWWNKSTFGSSSKRSLIGCVLDWTFLVKRMRGTFSTIYNEHTKIFVKYDVSLYYAHIIWKSLMLIKCAIRLRNVVSSDRWNTRFIYMICLLKKSYKWYMTIFYALYFKNLIKIINVELFPNTTFCDDKSERSSIKNLFFFLDYFSIMYMHKTHHE